MTDYPFITVFDIAAELHVTRQRVHQIIKTFDIKYTRAGSVFLVDKKSYLDYRKLRTRRDLAMAAGRTKTKFIRSAIHDTVCHDCGSYAVKWKETIACENGHNYHYSGEV